MNSEKDLSSCKTKSALSKRRYWEKQMGLWEDSGLTQPAFCKKHKLSYPSFIYWRLRLSKQQAQSKEVSTAKIQDGGDRFIALTIEAPAVTPKTEHFQIHYPNGFFLNCSLTQSSKSLRHLFKALGMVV